MNKFKLLLPLLLVSTLSANALSMTAKYVGDPNCPSPEGVPVTNPTQFAVIDMNGNTLATPDIYGNFQLDKSITGKQINVIESAITCTWPTGPCSLRNGWDAFKTCLHYCKNSVRGPSVAIDGKVVQVICNQ